LCLYGDGRFGVLATQARFNPLYGGDGLKLLSEGASAAEAVSALIEADAGRARRQLHVIDASDRIGQHTGMGCVPWAGHARADGVSVAGNMLAGEAVVRETLAAYLASSHLPFADRLITALDRGDAAGGDKRGRQSAAVRLWLTESYAVLDLRVDDHPEPLAELRRLYGLAGERYLPTVATLATRRNPAGIFEDAERDRAMAASALRF
jgi:uncharacterized Ntn-hydrolase superfamily protein